MVNRNYIHDIKPSSRVQRRRDAFHRAHDKRVHDLEESFVPERPNYASGRSSVRGVWYVAVIVILILVFALTYVFAGATVFVTPRTGTVELSGPILAQKDTSTNGALTFEMLSLSDEASTVVDAGEKQYVEKKATGTVRLFNNTTSEQKLLIDTRLESPDGYIYKTKVATVIPAQKTENGKTVPGSVDVDIYADEAGDVYNLDEADFKIVGFRGSPKYETMYGKTITPITGGFKGETYDVGEDVLNQTKASLQDGLKASLVEKARAELPNDFVMYDNVTLINFDEPAIEDVGTDGKVKVVQKGTIDAPIFKKETLTSAIVSKVVTDTADNQVVIPDIENLNLKLDQGSAIADPTNISDIKVVINDKVDVVWEVDDAAVKDALVGIKKRDFQNKMLEFKNVDKAELTLKPFWKSTMPDKTSAIKIINTLENAN